MPDADDCGTFYWTSLAIFARDAKATLRDENKLAACEQIGWTADYLMEAYGAQCVWVHPYYTKVYSKDSKKLLYTKVEFWEEPILLVDSERSRMHYKSRADFEHDAECDLNASTCIEEDIVRLKPDCDLTSDDLTRMMPSDPDQSANTIDIYEGGDTK